MCASNMLRNFSVLRGKGVVNKLTTVKNVDVTWTQASFRPPQIFRQVYAYANTYGVVVSTILHSAVVYFVASEI